MAPPERFTLDLPLLRLDVEPGRIAGIYRPVTSVHRTMHVRLPNGARSIEATIEHQPQHVSPDVGGEVRLVLDCQAGRPVSFEVRYSRETAG
jgi:hypothetical protein